MMRMRVYPLSVSIFVLTLLCVFASGTVAAQIPGGDFRGLAFDKGSGYALLLRYDVFMSPDGENWKPAGFDMVGDDLVSVAGAGNAFLAGTASGRIVRFAPGSKPSDLATVKDPFGRIVAPVKMIAAAPGGRNILISSGQGVMVSMDSGNSFQPVADPFWNDRSSREILAVGYVGKTAMVFTRKGAYYSKGDKFLPSAKGLPKDASPSTVFIDSKMALAAFPRIGIFQTTNGTSWKKLASAPDDPIAFLGTTSEGIVAAGPFSPIFLGDSKGKNWTRVEGISPGFNPVASMMSPDGALIVLRGKGLYRIKDEALQPVQVPGSLASVFSELQVPGALLAGTAGGVFRSVDGKTWEDVTPADLGVPVTGFLRLPDKSILLSSSGLGSFISKDEGKTWTQWNDGLGTANTFGDFILDGDTVLAATENGLMERAVDGSTQWQPAPRGVPREKVYKLAQYAGRIWAASVSGVYSGKSQKPLVPIKGLEGTARDLSTDGDILNAVVDKSVYFIDSRGRAKKLGPLPEGLSPTSVALSSGKTWVGTTAGVYSYTKGSWVAEGNRRHEVRTIQPESEGVRVVTAGAGTFYLK